MDLEGEEVMAAAGATKHHQAKSAQKGFGSKKGLKLQKGSIASVIEMTAAGIIAEKTQEVVTALQERLFQNTPVWSGQAVANWTVTEGTKSTREIPAPGPQPTSKADTARIAANRKAGQ